MKMGVVADDVTGSNDIGIMFAKCGYVTDVHAYAGTGAVTEPDSADIVILNTNSRLDPAELAYQKVFAATRALKQAGCRQFHKKTCSVFRGNIGAEFDAMLDALGLDFAVVVLGFPKNGRTTVDGIHYVHGRRLEDSEFRRDPVQPMRRSDLAGILQMQTNRRVGLLPHEVVEKGPDTLRQAIQAMHSRFQYVILDVTDQRALAIIARAVKDEPVLCGSSAIAEELPPVWGPAVQRAAPLTLPTAQGLGILIAAGSLMPQTRAQIEHLTRKGTASFQLDTSVLLEEKSREAYIENISAAAVECMRSGRDVIVHTPNRAEDSPNTEFSRLVSSTLAEVARRVLAETGQNRVIVAGGETSDAVCERLGVRAMRILSEIEPGLPSCVTLNEPQRVLVLKSGSFGREDFFERALEHLKSI